MKKETWLFCIKALGLLLLIAFLYVVFEDPRYFQSLTMPTGMVIGNGEVQSLVSMVETRLQSDPYSTEVTISSLVQNGDGSYEMNVSFLASQSEEQGLITLHNLDNPTSVTTIQTGHYGRFSTDIVYVDGSFTMTNATIRLPTYAPITKLLKCADDYWNQASFNCSQWENVSIPFTGAEGYIEFTVDSFSGYVGTSHTYDSFEDSGSGTNYCGNENKDIWTGSICASGAGSFTIINDPSLAYMDKKFANVTKLNSGNSSKIRVEVYDQYGKPGKTSIYVRSYVNVQNVSVASGTNYAWIFLGVADATEPLPYLQAFAFIDENESLGCGYFSGSGQGTFAECAGQTKQNVSINSWNQVELYYNRNGQVTCWLNSSVFCNQTGISFNNEQIRYVTLGVADNSVMNATGTLFFDEYRAAASLIGGYPSITNITLSNTTIYDDQNISIWALITDPDSGDSIQTVFLNKSVTELFQFPQMGSESRAGTLTSSGSNYSLVLNESLYAKSPLSDSYTVYLSLYANDSVGQVRKGTSSILVLDGSPTVSLDTVQGVWSNTGNITLNCSVTDPSNNLYNISLYTNISGSATVYQTQNISGNISSVSFNVTNLGAGVYGWNCESYDSESLDGDSANSDNGDQNRTFTVDMTAPSTITNVTNESVGLTWIRWNWTNPTDTDLNHTEVWLNGSFTANVSSPTNSYVATGLANTTNYTASIRSVDHAGNVNTTFTNNTASTSAVPDLIPPGTLTNLTNVSVTDASITWNWTNPSDEDYNHVELYVEGTFVENVSYVLHNYTALGLQNNTNYTLSTRTVDHSGNINTSWINSTAATAIDTTAPGTISSLWVVNRDSSWLQWNWTNANNDYNHSLLYLNGSYVSMVSAPDHVYTASSLLADTVYMLSVRSVDHYGNINTTWVNNSAQTNVSYCGDTRCDAGESCSSCPVDCGECPVGDNSGGGTPVVTIIQTEPKISRAWDTLEWNAEVTWRIYDKAIAITELSFTTTKTLEHPEISITTYANRPVGLYESVDGRLYNYLHVQTKNMASGTFGTVKFQFAVEKAWLDANQLAMEDVVLYRYTSDWVGLPTTKIDETSLAVTYTAEAPGFSYFAIAGKKQEPKEPVVTEPVVEQQPEPIQEVIPEVREEPKEPEPERPEVMPSNKTTPKPGPWGYVPKEERMLLFGFTVIVLIIGCINYVRQKKKKVALNDQTL